MDIYRTDTHLIIIQSPHRIEIPLGMLEKDYVAQAERLLKELEEQSKFIPNENANLVPIPEEQLTPDDWTRLKWLKEARDEALLKTDYTQLPDTPVTEADRARYRVVRQALRDLPATVNLDQIMSREDVKIIITNILEGGKD